MPDSDAIDVAVVAKLRGRAELLTAAPGNVHLDRAPQGTVDPFVIVRLQASRDHHVMEEDGIGFEEAFYEVKAVGRDPVGVRNAGRELHTALNGQELAITGYGCMDVTRTERFVYIEPAGQGEGDEEFLHRGGIYRVCASH